MGIATVAFWMGRWKFVHVPPSGLTRVVSILRDEGCAALVRLLPIYLFVAVFWSLYDQGGSAWVQQAAAHAPSPALTTPHLHPSPSIPRHLHPSPPPPSAPPPPRPPPLA